MIVVDGKFSASVNSVEKIGDKMFRVYLWAIKKQSRVAGEALTLSVSWKNRKNVYFEIL